MKKVVNVVIVLLALIVGFLLVDLLVFKSLIPKLPLDRIVYLERPMRALAVNSKDALVPKNPYLTIVGDSYAKGNGDWILDVDKTITPAPPYQAAHLLHEMLDVDVLPLGRAGGGSLRTIASDLVNQYDYINKMWIYHLPEPQMILFYFYAGNDLVDNLVRIKRSYAKNNDMSRIYDEKYFQSWLDGYVSDNLTYFPLVNFTSIAYTGKVVADYLDRARNSIAKEFKDTTHTSSTVDWSKVNVVNFKGGSVQVGKSLQNFSLGLKPEEFRLGFYLLDQALVSACKRFPNAKKALVYIPPVLDCYTYSSPQVMSEKIVSPAQCRKVGLYMEKEAGRIAQKNGMLYINTSPGLRKAAEFEFIHGPKDFDHLNKKGYHVFARIIADKLMQAGWFPKVKSLPQNNGS